MILNFSNVEDIIFYDSNIQNLLPLQYPTFEQWKLSKRFSYLKDVGKQAVLDFLNQISEDEIKILEDYFSQKIIVEKLNYSVVSNIKIPINDCEELCKVAGFNYLTTWRDADYLYISLWR